MLVQKNGTSTVRLCDDAVCYRKPILKCWSFSFLSGCAKADKLRLVDEFADFELDPEKKTFRINEKCCLSGKIFGKIGVADGTDYETARLVRIEKNESKDADDAMLYRAVTSGGDQFYFLEDDQDHYWLWI